VRVLQVIQELAAGGAERVVLTLARGAQQAGHEVAVAAAPGALAGELDVPRFDLPLVHRRPWRLPPAALALRRAVRASSPDVVHLHNPVVALVGALASPGGGRAPGLVSVHGVPDEDYAGAARLLRLARRPVVACGPGVAAALEDAGVTVSATVVNGIAPAPEPASRATLAEATGIAAGRPLILSIGRLVPQKNHALAVRALGAVPEAVLAIVGEGPLAEQLEREARENGVADRFVLVGARDDARRLIAAADAVVLPSSWEGLPLVALETLAAGTPLVATSVRGIRELLQDDVDALLVPADDAGALAAALRRALTDASLRQRLRANGLEKAAGYGEDAMVSAYLDLYQRVRSGTL
jgi:glycosyltransferase involved in cell wall biosynthesis